jgi:HemX protein
MGENIFVRLHELIMIIYACSVFLYFIDFLHDNRKANRIAFWLLSFVWLWQTIFLIVYMFETNRFPILTMGEGLYFYVWVLITISLFINRFWRIDFLVFFTNVLGFVLLVIHTFAPFHWQSEAIANQLVSELLFIHITFSFLSYGAFSISFIFSLLYIIQYHLLKEKKWGNRVWRMSDLSKLEHMSYVLNVIGVPILLIGVILGLQWAHLKIPHLVWYDSKIIGTFIVLMVYSVYLYIKIKKNMYGRKLAMWNIGSFLIILINYFLFGNFSSFHLWYR